MWMLNIEEQLHVSYEEDNKHDDCVACVKSRLNLTTLVGHVPQEMSLTCGCLLEEQLSRR